MDAPGGMREIRQVAVIGAGRRGRSFALRCARAGFNVVLEDVMPSKLRSAEAEADREEQSVQSSLQYVTSVEDAVRDADVALDFVPDELESKLEIFSLLDRMAPPRTLLCTPTDALSISDLASCTYRAPLCVAVQFHGEDPGTGDVTLLRARQTSEAAMAAVRRWFEQMGASVEVVADDRDPTLTASLSGAGRSL